MGRLASIAALFFLVASGIFASAQDIDPNVGGTLNLVLANKNGAVIATDSRATSSNCTNPDDHSVKLFRTSEHSALAIAGFAASELDIPFSMKVAGVIGRHFDPTYNDSPELSSIFLSDWLDVQILPDIEGLASITEAVFPKPAGAFPRHYDFTATAVDVFEGEPHIVQSRLVQRLMPEIGPLGNWYPTFAIYTDEILADHFIFATAGIDKFVKPILLWGFTEDDDPSVKKYLDALSVGTRSSLTLDDLEALGRRLLNITAEMLARQGMPCVGGADQIAVLPIQGASSWELIDAPNVYSALDGSRFAVGVTFDAGKPDRPLGHVFPDHVDAVNRWHYVMLNNRITDSKVWLDRTIFLGNLLTNPIFIWNGDVVWFSFTRNRVEGRCTIQIGPDVGEKQLPGGFEKCAKTFGRRDAPPFDAVAFPTPLVVAPTSRHLN